MLLTIKEKAQKNALIVNNLSFLNYDIINIENSKILNSLFLKNLDAYLIQKEHIRKHALFNFYKTAQINIKYDILNYKPLDFKRVNLKIQYKQDSTKYLIVNKKPRYKDISINQILRILLNTDKITKGQFKHSIKAIKHNQKITDLYDTNDNKTLNLCFKGLPKTAIKDILRLFFIPLKDSITEQINAYFKTFKSNKSKNTLRGLTAQQDKRTRFKVTYKGQSYKILLKKYKQDIYLNQTIEQEGKTKIMNSNKINPRITINPQQEI